jgi:hypothetical protein
VLNIFGFSCETPVPDCEVCLSMETSIGCNTESHYIAVAYCVISGKNADFDRAEG